MAHLGQIGVKRMMNQKLDGLERLARNVPRVPAQEPLAEDRVFPPA